MAEVVALVDYGAGNLHSVANALKAAGCGSVAITANPDVVRAADRIVLPGVGSYRACAEGLRALDGMVEAMAEGERQKLFYALIGAATAADAKKIRQYPRFVESDGSRQLGSASAVQKPE